MEPVLEHAPVRHDAVDGALGVPEALERLEAFLAEGSPAEALAEWYGPEALFLASRNRQALIDALDRDIAEIDALLTDQVNAILHAPRFQKLEASWRGLAYLCGIADGVEGVLVRVLNAHWAEICRDLERAIEFDQSGLFEKIYSDEFGMPGGKPYGVLIGDYAVQHRPGPGHKTDDVAALSALAQVAAAAFAPVVLGCEPAMFGTDSFQDFGLNFDVRVAFSQPEYQRWLRLQSNEDARFIGITVPRILMRLPYLDDGQRHEAFRYREDARGLKPEDHLWGNAAYAFGGVLIRAFGASGWFADIRGTRRDETAAGLVTGLPVPWFATDAQGVAPKPVTEVVVNENLEKELADLGFVPLSRTKDLPLAVFYGNASLHRPPRYDTAIANANARLSVMLQYILCVSRFSHYLKVIGRDRTGSLTSADDCQRMLMSWLLNYVTGNDDAGPETKARYPLREAAVEVRDVPGKPGSFRCTIHLKPHFQLDQVVSSFKLVTELAPATPA